MSDNKDMGFDTREPEVFENAEPDHIVEEKECIDNFIDHFILFCDQIGNNPHLDRLNTGDVTQLYTAYLDQRRDSL